jgi:hypothetical protein
MMLIMWNSFWTRVFPAIPFLRIVFLHILGGISDLEEDAISDAQSFNEDDMYYSAGSDDEDDATVPIPESEGDSGAPSDDAVLAHLESMDDVLASLVGKVGHQNV